MFDGETEGLVLLTSITINNTINVSFIDDSDLVVKVLNNMISDSTNTIAIYVDKQNAIKDISRGDLYLIPEYDESANDVKLSELLNILNVNSNKIYVDDTELDNKCGLRSTDKYVPKVAYEINTRVY